MAEYNNDDSQETIALTIDLTSSRALFSAEDDAGSIKKLELNDGGIRLIVSVPSMVDAEQANLTAAKLLDQIEMMSGRARVERVKITAIQVRS